MSAAALPFAPRLNLKALPITLGTQKGAVAVSPAGMNAWYLNLPVFDISTAFWYGASIVVGVIPVDIGYNYAFRVPLASQSTTFCPTIKWVIGSTVFRYKLWSPGTELLPYPLYSGEMIPTGAHPTIEIWNCQGEPFASRVIPWKLLIGALVEPTGPCDRDNQPQPVGNECTIAATYGNIDSYFLTCLT